MHCETPNPDGWFYCKTCGNKTSEPKFTTNMYMISEIGKRSDIEFSTTTMDDVIIRDKNERGQKSRKFWEGKLKEFNKGRYA